MSDVRQVCPQHEQVWEICDCDCTCDKATHVSMGIKGTHHTTECRLPVFIEKKDMKRRP